MTASILVFNCGSSSIKFAVVNPDNGQRLIEGQIERLGLPDTQLTIKAGDQKNQSIIHAEDINAAITTILEHIQQHLDLSSICAVGHRVVHGGEMLSATCLIDASTLEKITGCAALAPLHNPVNLAGIEIAMQSLPSIPHAACFDTAFHQTMPPEAYLYPVPYQWYEDHGVRKYGFHGTSHRFVSQTAIQRFDLDPNNSGLIIAHLGNGCSLSAVKNSQSVDTTMGLTPLDGLMMGTRSGSIDPGIHAFMSEQLNSSLDKITTILNKKSGLLGVSGVSSDMRDLQAAASDGNRQAQAALELFCNLCSKQIAALATQLNSFDGLIFTGGIGENDRWARAHIVQKLSLLGLQINDSRNDNHGKDQDGQISNSKPIIAVIPTDEEWQIAKETQALL